MFPLDLFIFQPFWFFLSFFLCCSNSILFWVVTVSLLFAFVDLLQDIGCSEVFVAVLMFVDAFILGVFVKFMLFSLYILDCCRCCFQQLTML